MSPRWSTLAICYYIGLGHAYAALLELGSLGFHLWEATIRLLAIANPLLSPSVLYPLHGPHLPLMGNISHSWGTIHPSNLSGPFSEWPSRESRFSQRFSLLGDYLYSWWFRSVSVSQRKTLALLSLYSLGATIKQSITHFGRCVAITSSFIIAFSGFLSQPSHRYWNELLLVAIGRSCCQSFWKPINIPEVQPPSL